MKRGFTLIELLIVIAIIGILSALIIPALKRAAHKTAKEPVPVVVEPISADTNAVEK